MQVSVLLKPENASLSGPASCPRVIFSLIGKTPLFCAVLISILPKNHAGPVEKLINDFFRMPKKVGANDSL